MERLLMKVAKKLLLLTVASGLLLASTDAGASRRRSSTELNCRTQAQACQDKIAKQDRQIKGLIAAIKKARSEQSDDSDDYVDDSASDAVSPALASEVQSIIDRSNNMLKIVEQGFNKSNIGTFNKYLGRALDRARKAHAAAGNGTQEFKETQSIIARLNNVKAQMDNLKGRVSRNQLENITKTVVEQLVRIKDRAEGVSGEVANDGVDFG